MRKESTTQEPPEESQQEPPELQPVTKTQPRESHPSTTEPAPIAPEPPREAVSPKPLSKPAASHEMPEGTQQGGREVAEAVSFQDSQDGERSTPREDMRESSVGRSGVLDQEAAQGETPAVPESQPEATELPIKDYDSLNTAQVTKRLSGLSVEELERLRDYEAEHTNRRLLMERLEKRIRTIRQTGTTEEAKESPEKISES